MEQYDLREVAEGAWAAVAAPGGEARANAGIVDLGDETLVFDTFMHRAPAEALRADARRLTGRDPSIVVNSHWHGDHVRGNEIFAGAEIVATPRTKELVEEQGAAHAPTATFDGERDLGRARLLTYGGGHTESDAFLHLPEDAVAFVADLVVIDTHPWVGHGDVASWLGILARLEELELDVLVPGHGPVGVGDDVALMRAYLEQIRRLRPGDEMPPELADLGNPGLFERNLEALAS